jgi:hypothetical protein
VRTQAPVAQDLSEAKQRLIAVLTPRSLRRRSPTSRTISRGFKVSSREARALRVMARALGVPSDTGAVLLRAFSLQDVMEMYDRHLAERQAVRQSA